MKTKKLFIDTDMGNDDIMAICMFLLDKAIEIIGISTVNGVSTKDAGYNNIINLLKFLNKKIAVAQGYKEALHEKIAKFPRRDITRANRLSLLKKLDVFKEKPLKENTPIEKFIYEKLTEKTTIMALGPLTNIAATIKAYGELFTQKIERLIIMGGGIEKGNVPPGYFAEYNIWLDPEAADIVFSSQIPITMIGIDATSYVPVTKEFIEMSKKTKPNRQETKVIKEIIVNNDNDFDAFYDPLAAYCLLNTSSIVSTLQSSINVELSGIYRGRTQITNKKLKNVTIVIEANAELFYNYILNVLSENVSKM